VFKRVIRGALLSRAALGWLLFPLAAASLVFAGSRLAVRPSSDQGVTSLPFTPPPAADYGAWPRDGDAVDTPPPTSMAAAMPSPVGLDLSERPGPQFDDSLKDTSALPAPTSPGSFANAASGAAGQVNPPVAALPPTELPPALAPTLALPLPVPTDVPPPTAVPPTAIPPTAVPPTDVPPTTVPPSPVPPTAKLPTAVPPTAVLPTAVLPTIPPLPPPTEVPPTQVPPTQTPEPPPPTDLPPPTAVADVTLCHRPPGNPAAAHTIVVDPSEVAGHLGHGDSLGPCR
jgi:hypothetical protein